MYTNKNHCRSTYN